MLVSSVLACAAVPEAGVAPNRGVAGPTAPVPAGFGSLRPDDLTLQMSEGPLTIELTPLAEGHLRLLVPDAAERLRGISRLAEPFGSATPVLVTFYTETQGTRFEQSDVVIESGGRTLRATRVVGATQGWGTGLLRQREPASGVFLFPDLELEREFTVRYRTVRSDGWRTILPRVQVERGRVRGRAGG